ncbi:MAG: ribulose 1,5-bisphosphate carboxylase, partial [Octadecabacter sp.]
MTRLTATYEIESPVGVQRAAEVMAGEQSTGTFVRLASETDELRDRSAARLDHVEITGTSDHPALPCRLSAKTYEQGRVMISWP